MNVDVDRTPGSALPRVAGIFGLVASLVTILAVVFTSQINTSSDDLARSVQEITQHRFAAEASAWLFALGIAGWLPLFLGLAVSLGRRGSGLAWSGGALLIAFVVIVAPINLVEFVIAHHLAPAITAGDSGARSVAEGMLGFGLVVDKMAHVVFGIGALLTARAMWADGRFPKWLPAVAAVAGIVMSLYALALAVPALEAAIAVGSLFALVWMVGSSLWLLGMMRSSEPVQQQDGRRVSVS